MAISKKGQSEALMLLGYKVCSADYQHNVTL